MERAIKNGCATQRLVGIQEFKAERSKQQFMFMQQK